ncbi:endo alpha-1,4 polygalactosaminidase [Streptomyces sp. LX-29]|uniref:endo alpha-1,4 polygalactosaminidase n=1 Tax=Streptomyces sp. LX-29 TaxID=2900152 RepID=UPI00240E2B57|nr:endo alpha-1,4 polygalactosaminidase [Streptomyces sp. LX-29]WFB11875.1 endo alpha-1,4 polygalactosaminidase [Streptomyces sp. LX-29]
MTATGCSDGGRSEGSDRTRPPSSTTAPPAADRVVEAPTADMAFDYQIGGPYPPPAGVRAVARDRTAPPAKGAYNVCYVNTFQAQPDAVGWWRKNHPELLLRDADGELIVDEDWDEPLLDISTAAKRTELAAIVGRWIDGCARSGYQALEPDNLDSYERSDGRLDKGDNIAFARLLAARAHRAGLAIGQKNTTELLPERASIGFDFAVVEECGRYDECEEYAEAYRDRVFVIEYSDADFRKACAAWGGRLSIVSRDLDVRPAGEEGYAFRRC